MAGIKEEKKTDPPENRRPAIFFGLPILNSSQQIWDMPSVENHPFDAYHGPDPFIFVSYSHKDGEEVFSEIGRLHRLGYRIWYDEGIDPGNEWTEEIARALEGAASFMVFISDHAVRSSNVRNEINFALNYRKPFLAIHLAEIKLPRGLELRMADIQAIYKWQSSEEQYHRKLERALLPATKEVVGDAGAFVVPEPVPTPMPTSATGCLAKDPAQRPQSMTEVQLGDQSFEELHSQSASVGEAVVSEQPRTFLAGPATRAESALPTAETPLVQPRDENKALIYDENVQFTIYRPKVIAPKTWHTLLAFAHLSEKAADAPESDPDPCEEVMRQAKQILADQATNYGDVTQDSRQAIPRQGEITLMPEVEGIEFNPRQRTFLWEEAVHREEFRLRTTGGALDLPKILRGRITVFLGAIIVADIQLMFRIDVAVNSTPAQNTESDRARPYRKIFTSYSHQDNEIVDQIIHYASVSGDEYLRDTLHLRSGQEWNRGLLVMIDQADIFQLFWSSNSMRSPYVRQEWEHALSLSRPYFIRPVYWEDPLPMVQKEGLPPESLTKLHFQRIRALQPVPVKPDAIPPVYAASASPPSSARPKRIGGANGMGMAAAVLVLCGLSYFFGVGLPKKPLLVGQIAYTTSAAPSVAPAPPAITPVPTASVDPAVVGVWYLKMTINNLPALVTADYDPNGSWKSETVLSDKGTYQMGGGRWVMTSKITGAPVEGTYRFIAPQTVELTGPQGTVSWSVGPPGTTLDPNKPSLIGTWKTTLHPPNTSPCDTTMTFQADGTYSTQIAFGDGGTWTSGIGQMVQTSRITGVTNPVTYRSLGPDSMAFTWPLGTTTWSRKQP